MKELVFFSLSNYSGLLTEEQYKELLEEMENGIDW